MRGCVISTLLLLVIAGICIGCAAAGEKTCQELQAAVDALPPVPEKSAEAIKTLSSLWDRSRLFFVFCVHQSAVSQWERELEKLKGAAEANDPTLYRTERRLLSSCLEELRLTVGFGAEGFL